MAAATVAAAGLAALAAGPPSGSLLGTAPINGITTPFATQPLQGFSAILDNGDGTVLAMPDNGCGSTENSADYRLGVYRITRPFVPVHDDRGRGGDSTPTTSAPHRQQLPVQPAGGTSARRPRTTRSSSC